MHLGKIVIIYFYLTSNREGFIAKINKVRARIFVIFVFSSTGGCNKFFDNKNHSTRSLPKTCRGGDSCCSASQPCSAGQGDCDQDSQCEDTLVCGNNNCGRIGGEWDSEDDCCERRCFPSQQCSHAEGHCEYDSDCERSGYHVCNKDCISGAFPTAQYPNNTLSKYSTSDKCCARR